MSDKKRITAIKFQAQYEKRLAAIKRALQLGLVETARKLRNRQTPAENAMDRLLEEHFDDYGFQAQYPFQRYIIDFYSEKFKICIEMDGRQHGFADRAEYDAERDQYLQCQGIIVLRFQNAEVFASPGAVIARLRKVLV